MRSNSAVDPYTARFPGRNCCDAPRVEYIGQLGDSKPGYCDHLAFMFCIRCGATGLVPCGASRPSRCRPCAKRYRANLQKMVVQGLRESPPGLFLTPTAPGDRQHCMRHKGCSGDGPKCVICPCTPEGGVDIGEWNRTLTARANRLLQAIRRGEASPKIRGRRAPVPLAYVQFREPQDGKRRRDGIGRYALHPHIPMVRSDGKPLQLDKSLVRALCIEHGFGHQVDLQAITSDAGLADYASKKLGSYCVKGAEDRELVPWGCDDEGRPVKATYRVWTRSGNWPSSLKRVKEELRRKWLDQAVYAESAELLPLVAFNSASYTTDLLVSVFPGCAVGHLTVQGVEYGGSDPPVVVVVDAMATQLELPAPVGS
jgi:hypothetical protein